MQYGKNGAHTSDRQPGVQTSYQLDLTKDLAKNNWPVCRQRRINLD